MHPKHIHCHHTKFVVVRAAYDVGNLGARELLFPVQSVQGNGHDMKFAIQPYISLASLLSMITFSMAVPADQQPHAIISALVGDSLHDLPAKIGRAHV